MPEENIVNIILKLFDTLKETMKDTNSSIKNLQSIIGECVHKVDMITLDDLKRGLNDHTKEASEKSEKTVNVVLASTSDINKKLDNIHIKLKQMIVIVITAVTLFSLAIFVADIYNKPDMPLQKTLVELTKALDDHNKSLTKRENNNEIQLNKIKELEKTIKELQRNLELHETRQ